jgi:hypothetical protein
MFINVVNLPPLIGSKKGLLEEDTLYSGYQASILLFRDAYGVDMTSLERERYNTNRS